MIYFISGIIIFNIVLFLILRNVKRYFLVGSVIDILAGYLIIIIGYILKTYFMRKINYINISRILNYLLTKNNNNGLILILIGSVNLIIYVILFFISKKKELINNSSIYSLSRIHFGI